MRSKMQRLVLVVVFLLASMPLLADDLRGATRLLCTSVQATVCSMDGDCEVGVPWNWNIPQFIEVDLDGKKLSTTKASGENRETSFANFKREDGLLFLQGIEQGRAFSFVIREDTGYVSIAVAREGITVSVFGACTPIP